MHVVCLLTCTIYIYYVVFDLVRLVILILILCDDVWCLCVRFILCLCLCIWYSVVVWCDCICIVVFVDVCIVDYIFIKHGHLWFGVVFGVLFVVALLSDTYCCVCVLVLRLLFDICVVLCVLCLIVMIMLCLLHCVLWLCVWIFIMMIPM